MAMSAVPVLWLSHPACLRHEMGVLHPECPKRLEVIEDRLLVAGLSPLFRREEAPAAPRAALLRAHDAKLVDFVLGTQPEEGYVHVDPDTSLNAYTATAAVHAAGAVVRGVEALLAGEAQMAFCAVRPPGHHAERATAMGFCFFNNVAIGAYHALACGLSRVAVLDFDVHYGNGTANIVAAEPRILLCSTYQFPLYPDWKSGHGIAHLVDVELAPGAGTVEFREAVVHQWRRALDAHRPEMILVSAGFDAHAEDPLGNMRLRYDDFGWVATWIRDYAQRHCNGRVLATLEGGYDLHALARSVEAFMRPFVE